MRFARAIASSSLRNVSLEVDVIFIVCHHLLEALSIFRFINRIRRGSIIFAPLASSAELILTVFAHRNARSRQLVFLLQ